ncbi:hypothetical protein HYU92_03605 [Candidatus Curtissbacteria bacterium]|nr:hypothetical protein [Candidatus Curtissbacteria bacterium]
MSEQLMNTDTKALTKNISPEKPKSIVKKLDIKEFIDRCAIADDPISILKQAQEELDSHKNHSQKMTPESTSYKAFTIFEFDKGILMATAIPEAYRTFCIDFSRKLQKEYQCETPSEKATAELVAINFVRTLIIQDRMNAFLALGSVTDNTVKYFAVLSKELDRANRHYLTALQTLKMIKQPALEVNIKTQTAIVGQNQIVQSNNK